MPRVRATQRRGPLVQLVRAIDGLVDPLERATATDRLTAALADGRLTAAEFADRSEKLADCYTDAAVEELLADLDSTPLVVTPDNLRSLPSQQRRLCDDDRQQALVLLKGALDKGRLGLTEYDLRVRHSLAAATVGDLGQILDDLGTPAQIYRRPRGRIRRAVALLCFTAVSTLMGYLVIATYRNPGAFCAASFVAVVNLIAMLSIPSKNQPDYLTGLRRKRLPGLLFAAGVAAGVLLFQLPHG
ncbi:hypothetical protein GCM10010170_084740 [Dactylosporangium salmoneum]|uniref:DUF1707 domain-containing protein n=2 Tax=Dactylosporangium salmoneum TaxID=53361 RepID=A0ABP5UGR9_9ACTN